MKRKTKTQPPRSGNVVTQSISLAPEDREWLIEIKRTVGAPVSATISRLIREARDRQQRAQSA